jgi:hypothetical protein
MIEEDGFKKLKDIVSHLLVHALCNENHIRLTKVLAHFCKLKRRRNKRAIKYIEQEAKKEVEFTKL